MISGNPVYSATSVTGIPLSRSARAVPPVDSSSKRCALRRRVSSTSAVLSETDNSARLTLCMRRSAQQAVLAQLAAQRPAIEAQHAGGPTLIAVRVIEHGREHGGLDFAHHQLVEPVRIVIPQGCEITLEGL